jgi:hypothetical protein
MRAILAAVCVAILVVPAAAQTVPAYRIVAEEKTDTSRTVDVRVERRLGETDIGSIANAVVNREQRPYLRTIVNFSLPSARTGEPPWASATLVREVRVKIPGLRLDEEQQFTAEARADKRDQVGSWLTSTPATPGRLTIYRENKRLFAEWRMRSGVRSLDEVTETRVSAGRRFDLKSGNTDDHFLVTHAGDLEIRAKGALIAVAERIKDGPPLAQVVASARERGQQVERWPPAPAGEAVLVSAEVKSEQQAATVAEPTGRTPKANRPTPPRKLAGQPTSPKIDLSVYLQPSG